MATSKSEACVEKWGRYKNVKHKPPIFCFAVICPKCSVMFLSFLFNNK